MPEPLRWIPCLPGQMPEDCGIPPAEHVYVLLRKRRGAAVEGDSRVFSDGAWRWAGHDRCRDKDGNLRWLWRSSVRFWMTDKNY